MPLLPTAAQWLNPGCAKRSYFVESDIAPPLRLKWKRSARNQHHMLFNGEMLIVHTDGMIAGVDPETGASRWEFLGYRKREFEFSNLTGDAHGIYFDTDTGNLKRTRNKVRALDWSTGRLLWELKNLPLDDGPSLLATDGRLFCGGCEIDTATGKQSPVHEQMRCFVHFGHDEYAIQGKGVYDRTTHSLLWPLDRVFISIWMSPKYMVGVQQHSLGEVSSYETFIYEIRTGRILVHLPVKIWNVVIGEHSVFGSDDNSLFRIDLATGAITWTKKYSGINVFPSQSILTNRYVWHGAVSRGHDWAGGGHSVRAYDPESGTVVWSLEGSGARWIKAVAGNCLIIGTLGTMMCFEPGEEEKTDAASCWRQSRNPEGAKGGAESATHSAERTY